MADLNTQGSVFQKAGFVSHPYIQPFSSALGLLCAISMLLVACSQDDMLSISNEALITKIKVGNVAVTPEPQTAGNATPASPILVEIYDVAKDADLSLRLTDDDLSDASGLVVSLGATVKPVTIAGSDVTAIPTPNQKVTFLNGIPQTLEVTAQDGMTKKYYRVTVNPLSKAAVLTKIKVAGLEATPKAQTTANATPASPILVEIYDVAKDADLSLHLTDDDLSDASGLVVSLGATVKPVIIAGSDVTVIPTPNQKVTFLNGIPQTLEVTAQDGMTKKYYRVTVNPLSKAAVLTKIKVAGLEATPKAQTTANATSAAPIEVELFWASWRTRKTNAKGGTSLGPADLTLDLTDRDLSDESGLTLSSGATVKRVNLMDGGNTVVAVQPNPFDFVDAIPQFLEVTAEDGRTKKYYKITVFRTPRIEKVNFEGSYYFLGVNKRVKRNMPMVVVLHGDLRSESLIYKYPRDWKSLWEKSKEPFILLIPLSPNVETTKAWPGLVDWRTGSEIWPNSLPQAKWLKRLIDNMTSSYRVDTDRIYAIGWSGGGVFLSKHGFSRFKDVFNGIQMLCGASPDPESEMYSPPTDPNCKTAARVILSKRGEARSGRPVVARGAESMENILRKHGHPFEFVDTGCGGHCCNSDDRANYLNWFLSLPPKCGRTPTM